MITPADSQKQGYAPLSAEEEYDLFGKLDDLKDRVNAQKDKLNKSKADEETLEKYNEIRTRLYLSNYGLLGHIMNRNFRNCWQDDEVTSVGEEALFKALNKFDRTRGYKFSSYACSAIRKNINKYIITRKRLFSKQIQLTPEYEGDSDNPFNKLIVEEENMGGLDSLILEDAFKIIETKKHKLTPKQREVFDLRFYEELSLREIGEKLNLTHQAIDFRIKRALKKIRESLTSEEMDALMLG